MIAATRTLSFGHHALAVLASVMAGASFMALVTAILALAGEYSLPSLTWLAMMVLLVWMGTFMLALPAAGLVLSVIFPVTRKLTTASGGICVLTAVITGLILAPMASHGRGLVTWQQLLVYAAVGVVIGGAYLATGLRLARDRAARAQGSVEAVQGRGEWVVAPSS